MKKWLKVKIARLTTLLFFILYCCFVFSLEKRPAPKSMTTSVIIPCHYKHARFLSQIIKEYSSGSVLPDEIVISLSNANKVSQEIINAIKSSDCPFEVVLLTSDQPLSAGGNRDKAAKIAKGDILICHDADDLPHPQRIEIIKYFFENYELDHLMHGWSEANAEISYYTFDQLAWFETPTYTNQLGGGTYCNGPIAITKQVFNSIQWTEKFIVGEDVGFNQEVYKKFPNRMVLKTPIYIYRHRLSAYKI
jgi:glycosyltransferase involved in cell wall biosynthesis